MRYAYGYANVKPDGHTNSHGDINTNSHAHGGGFGYTYRRDDSYAYTDGDLQPICRYSGSSRIPARDHRHWQSLRRLRHDNLAPIRFHPL